MRSFRHVLRKFTDLRRATFRAVLGRGLDKTEQMGHAAEAGARLLPELATPALLNLGHLSVPPYLHL